MSGPGDTPENTPGNEVTRDDPMIAAEWSLGLLEGEELLAARGKYASDPAFAWRKEWWDGWFAPLSDTMPGAEPGEHVWQGILARIAPPPAARAAPAAPAANVTLLETRLRRWQWATGLASAAAAVALVWGFVLAPARVPPDAPPSPPLAVAAAAPMVATVPIGETGLRLDVTYIPESERMVVAAIGLAHDGVHDHELWLVPAGGGAAHSLGVVAPGEVHSMPLPHALAEELEKGAGLVLTREPLGGKPEGRDAGPVVAKGAFSRV